MFYQFRGNPWFLSGICDFYFITYTIASISTQVNSKGAINPGPNHFPTLVPFLVLQEWKSSAGLLHKLQIFSIIKK